MADSILCSINMAGGAINIYYDTILAQNSLNSSGSTINTSIPSGWKVVIILSAFYSYDRIQHTLLEPYPIFTDTSNYLYMLTYYDNFFSGQSGFSMFNFAYVNSNRLSLNSRCSCTYIVAG